MKNILRLAFFVLWSVSYTLVAEGATGIFQTYIFISLNSSANLYEGNIRNPNNTDFPNFDGLIFSNPSSLVLTGAEAHTFKNNGGDVTGGTFYYRVYRSGTTPPAYNSFSIPFAENCSGGSFTGGAQCTAENNDQKWQATGQNIDLLAGITENGTYQIDTYFVMSSNQGNPTDGEANNPLTASVQITALPVALVGFWARQLRQSTHLTWSTATETNNSHFEVQRSANGRQWEALGEVKGAGTTQEAQQYKYIDYNPLTGLSYYRLRQADYDGQYEYSPVITASRKVKDFDFKLYPNPASNLLQIALPGVEKASGFNIALYNPKGQQVLQYAMAPQSRQELPLTGLPPGLYYLSVWDVSGQQIGIQRFVKE